MKKKNQSKELTFIKFDVWKHERDSLRRAFLEELVRQARSFRHLNNDFKLNPRLKDPIEKTVTGKVTFDWKILILFVLGFIIFGEIIYYFWGVQTLGTYASIVLGCSLISVLFKLIIEQSITKETLTTTEELFKDPHEFEAEFDRVVKAISAKRILIVIDNLDRCTHSKAVELLSTIKTFLAKDASMNNKSKCIFLIACDDEAIKEHLQYIYGTKVNEYTKISEEPFSAEEFLRKFFNTFMRVPKFIDTELQTYTESLLEDSGIPQLHSKDVAYVITNAFRENPRQIKQFINILIVHFLVARERENRKSPLIIPKGTITDNAAFLARFLIIQQKFPSEYNEIRRSNLTIKEMEHMKNPPFQDFLRATKTISVSDIRPFIYLKRSEEELSIPDIGEIEIGLIDNKKDLIIKKITSIKDSPEKIGDLQRFILSLMARNKDRKIPLLNITSCSLESFHHHKLLISQELCNKIADCLNDKALIGRELHSLEPLLVFQEVLVKCNEGDKSGIISAYLADLNLQSKDLTIDHAYSVIQELLKHQDWIKGKERTITGPLENMYFTSTKILSLFENNIDDQKKYISNNVINKFVDSFTHDDIETKQDINSKIKILLKFHNVIDPTVAGNILVKLDSLIKEENKKGYREEKENIIEQINDIFDKLAIQMKKLSAKEPLNIFSDTIVLGINALPDWNQRKLFIIVCLDLLDLLDDGPQKTKIDALVQGIFSNLTGESIEFVFNKLSKENIEALIMKYEHIFQKRILQHQQIFDLIYPLASEDIRIKWIDSLITSQLTRALKKIEELKYKVDDKNKVVEKLLQSVPACTVIDKQIVYEVINNMKCANDVDLRKVLATQIKGLLKNMDQQQQNVGYIALKGATYISAPLKREIAREVIEWLKSLEPANAGQTSAVNSVLLNWKDLESIVSDEYKDYVFDKLISRGTSIENINLGFEVLAVIKPKYKENEKYYENVLTKLISEPNNKIRIDLLDKLSSIANTKTKDFLDKVEQAKSKKESEKE